MPGGPNDPRGIPNLPFIVDSNRLTDGKTSTSPLSGSSPHFAEYTGQVANDSLIERKEHYDAIAANAALQGTAAYGAGDMDRELAVIKAACGTESWDSCVTSRCGTTPFWECDPINFDFLQYKPNVTFAVQAGEKWNPSSFQIQAGETYKIEVPGTQYWLDGPLRIGPEGYSAYYDAVSQCYVALGRCRINLRRRRRMPAYNWMSLLCATGEYVQKLADVLPEYIRYVPVQEAQLSSTTFFVGKELTFTAQNTGELVCFANDAFTQYFDNQGSLDVSVTRLSWPPKLTEDTVYYQRRLQTVEG